MNWTVTCGAFSASFSRRAAAVACAAELWRELGKASVILVDWGVRSGASDRARRAEAESRGEADSFGL